MKIIFGVLFVILTATLISGCSSGASGPLSPPGSDVEYMADVSAQHNLWGLWHFVIDPEAEKVDYIPLRSGAMHLNVLSLIEPPANVLLSVDGTPQFSGGNVTVDIALTHPVTNNVRYTGFDVKGIVIGRGSENIPDLVWVRYAGASELRVLNADGYTRWWNPAEFPYNPDDPTRGYIDGLLGVPDDVAHYDATLNPYKYFCDALTNPDDPVENIPVASRGFFSVGAKNVRRYVIDFTPSGLTFNYAVDAAWLPPTVPPPDTQVPDDFPPGANASEPYRVVVHEITNTLAYDITNQQASGVLNLVIDVYDWVDANLNFCCGYAANQELNGVCSIFPFDGGVGYSTYHVDTYPVNMTSADDVVYFITVEAQFPNGYGGILPGETQAALFPYVVSVEEIG